MGTEVYYHGTQMNNTANIIKSRKLIQGEKQHSQSEDGVVYICHERDFDQVVAYARNENDGTYTFVKLKITIDSNLHKHLQYEKKPKVKWSWKH